MNRAPFRQPTWRLLGCLLCLAGALLGACESPDTLEDIVQRQASGDYTGSIEPLRKLLEESPDDPQLLYLYGRTLTVVGETSLAEWSLRKAMEDPEWLLPAGLQLAYGALASMNFPEAIEIATRVLEAHPESVEALVMRANAHAHSRVDPEAALADVERIYELDPDNLDAMEPRILALLTLEDEERAAEAIEELGRRIDESDAGEGISGWHCATTALFAFESDDIELAEKRWEKCLELHPAHPNVVSNAVKFYDGQRRPNRSLEILERAHSEMPDSRDYRLALARRLTNAGRVAEAETLLREATETDNLPIAAAAWVDLAKHQQGQGDFVSAADSVGRGIAIARELDHPSQQLLFEYADALVLAREFDRALELTDEMQLPAYKTLIRARVAQDRGHLEEALAEYDEAFRLWPDNVWARYMAALAAEDLGDFDRAVSLYRYAIRLSAGETDARQRVARILLAEGKAPEALALLRARALEVPLDLEGELLSVFAWAMSGDPVVLGQALKRFELGNPEHFGSALARAAAGVKRHAGAVTAERLLRDLQSQGLVDFAAPQFAEALDALVEIGFAAGRGDAALADVRAAMAARPEDAQLNALYGRALELGDEPRSEIRGAYERALTLDADQPQALAGIGRLLLADDPAGALGYFERAAAVIPDGESAALGVFDALVALGRGTEAESRLDAFLADQPVAAAAAGALADHRIGRGETGARTLDLAQRAARFGGGPESQDRLSRLYAARGETALASAAAKKAQEMREPADG